MRFYDRTEELAILKKNWEHSSERSMMTTLIGRRRTGKTSLLLKSVEGTRYLYLYVSKDNEQMLCKKFQEQALASLGLQIYGQALSFADLFTELMRFGIEHHYTLIIDEFQNFLSINKAIPSVIQDIWDRYKDTTRVNLILCGSIYSMMKKIFENGDEPLYGRRDSNMRLLPFSVATLKQILKDHNHDYTPDDLLCLYMLTGGVAKYVALLMDAKATTKTKMLKYALSADSPFLTEGTELMVSEFGRDYGTYFSILQLIAKGMTTQSEIDSVIGKNTGAYLGNLCEDYTFISRNLPVLSKIGSRNIKWQIDDPFLRFWFRFIYPYQGLIESNQLTLLHQHVSDSYTQFTGKTLERYFHDLYMQTGCYTRIGNWWNRRGESELDMVAINEFDKRAVIAEIKRNSKKLDLAELQRKVSDLPSDFTQYQIELKLLSLEDM
ncbi:MAG: ATP-binding protein [Bacteroidaceae bacterium]|nr:ATP-binding protein [Bacteroidaceae bacterium]